MQLIVCINNITKLRREDQIVASLCFVRRYSSAIFKSVIVQGIYVLIFLTCWLPSADNALQAFVVIGLSPKVRLLDTRFQDRKEIVVIV